MKQNEINSCKAAKASDLFYLHDLTKTPGEYEQVITEDYRKGDQEEDTTE